MNERITEDIVRNHFKHDALFNSIKLEEQKSYSSRVAELLKKASKSGKGIGKPEFIISFPSANIDYLIVIECKAERALHASKHLDKPTDFAVDGVLHYAKRLSAQFDVIAIAASGQTEEALSISHFVWRKGEKTHKEIKEDKKLLSINSYLRFFNNEQFSDNLKNVDIIKKAIDLNELYQAYSITETTRCTIVSSILLSLLDIPFRKGYKDYSSSQALASAMLAGIENVLTKNKVKSAEKMLGEYRKILNEPLFQQEKIKHKNKKEREASLTVIKEMIEYLHRNVYPLVDMEQSGFDVLGRFYTEFIRYAGSEQSQGLVLTPFHITELFCDLAEITPHNTIYDPCCGTGGFLIAGMKRMLKLAGNNEDKKEEIKRKQLIGVELRPSMFTYACSNMMLRGDGKSNIYCDDCFSVEKIIKDQHKPNIAFLNPPYDVGATGQMAFIEHALNVVSSQNGTVVAIVQISCGIKNEKELISVKNKILENHRLHAVLSMPDDLFYPVGVVTSVMVFKANEKNTGKKTWFGYFKNDGFEKRKQRGRIDARGHWNNIRDKWISAYHNFDEVAGLSVKKEVTGKDEWCAEAYMETDYFTLCDTDFEKKMKDFIAFKFLNGDILIPSVEEIPKTIKNSMLNSSFNNNKLIKDKLSLNTSKWKFFKLDTIFEIYTSKDDNLIESQHGKIPYISSTQYMNGINAYIDATPSHNYNTITIARNGSVGSSFFHFYKYCASPDDVRILSPKFEINKYIGIFLTVLLEKEKYRYAYGRKFGTKRMKETNLKLPATVSGSPDWNLMENYIKSLPYSSAL